MTTAIARATLRYLARRRWWLLGGTAIIAVAALIWSLWPTPTPEPPRARQYLDYTACLLTGERGIAEPDAAPVWAGLQDASLTTHAKVQYLAIVGPQTVENGLPFLNSLAQAGCDLVLAAGPIPIATVDKGAPALPNARFLPVGPVTPRPNVSPINGGNSNEIRAAVSNALIDAVKANITR